MKPLLGYVISDRMAKTVTVEIKRQKAHPLYHKRVWLKKKYHAHNDLDAKTGDRVRIAETRPISKTKRWQVIEVMPSTKPVKATRKVNSRSKKVS